MPRILVAGYHVPSQRIVPPAVNAVFRRLCKGLSHDGRCWSKIATLPPLPGIQKPSGIGTLYSPVGEPGTLLAGGAGSSVGAGPLMRSDDGGKTWAAASSGLPASEVPHMLVHGKNGTLLLAFDCVLTCPGVARSSDDGRTWHVISGLGSVSGLMSVGDGSYLLLESSAKSTTQHPLSLVYRSRDDGRTWQQISMLRKAAYDLGAWIEIPWDARRILSAFGYVYLRSDILSLSSVDDGATFQQEKVLATPAGCMTCFPHGFAALPATHTMLLNSFGIVFRSTDDGETWHVVHAATSDDRVFWSLLVLPDGRTVYAGTDVGLYQSTDDGRTWHAALD